MKRRVLDTVLKAIQNKRILVLMGARQVGKTTLMKQAMSALQAKKQQCYYFTLEDKTVLEALNTHPENLFTVVRRPNPKEKVYVFIDEIQYLNDPSSVLKYLFDIYSPELKLIVTGSSAFYIDRNFKDSLAGRKQIIQIDPLDFFEYLQFTGANQLTSELLEILKSAEYVSSKQSALMQALEKYLVYGGYPEVVLAKTDEAKKEILFELQHSFLRKDLLESNIEEEEKFYALLRILSAQTGNLVNYSELSNTLKLNHRTVERYLYILQKCFHIQMLKPWHNNVRKELTKMPKVYFNDAGLRNAFTRNFENFTYRTDVGLLFEQFVFDLLRRKYDRNTQLFFWRTTEQQEVDFVVETRLNEGFAMECKWNEREYKQTKYKKFEAVYSKQFPLTLVSANFENSVNWVFKKKELW